MKATLTIPADGELSGGVMDDVDEDGRRYNRTLEGPGTYTAEYHDDGFWIIHDEALAIPDGNVPDEWLGLDAETQDALLDAVSVFLAGIEQLGDLRLLDTETLDALGRSVSLLQYVEQTLTPEEEAND